MWRGVRSVRMTMLLGDKVTPLLMDAGGLERAEVGAATERMIAL